MENSYIRRNTMRKLPSVSFFDLLFSQYFEKYLSWLRRFCVISVNLKLQIFLAYTLFPTRKSRTECHSVLISFFFLLQRFKNYLSSSVYSRCGFHEQAIESLQHTTNWNMALMESKLHGQSKDQYITLCRKFSGKNYWCNVVSWFVFFVLL